MIDHFIGKLLAFLDESGQAEHTPGRVSLPTTAT